MCASLLRQFGIKKVFYGASNDKFGGTGGVLEIQSGNGASLPSYPPNAISKSKSDSNLKLDEEGNGGQVGKGDGGENDATDRDYEVSGGWLREEAILMLRRFYIQTNERAPREKIEGRKERVLRLDVEPLSVPLGVEKQMSDGDG
jgi:tRNA-specific adenosine deaminase 2